MMDHRTRDRLISALLGAAVALFAMIVLAAVVVAVVAALNASYGWTLVALGTLLVVTIGAIIGGVAGGS